MKVDELINNWLTHFDQLGVLFYPHLLDNLLQTAGWVEPETPQTFRMESSSELVCVSTSNWIWDIMEDILHGI